MIEKNGYEVSGMEDYDTPALVFYPDRIRKNIRELLRIIPAGQLRPHIKTNKCAAVSRLMIDAGITKFKVATLAEAEMLAGIQAPDILFAFPPTRAKVTRLINLIRQYPAIRFSCIVDHIDTAEMISGLFAASALTADVYIDLNVGMNRTGIRPEQAMTLFRQITDLPAIRVCGLHAYDGHIKDKEYVLRRENCIAAFAPVLKLKKDMEAWSGSVKQLIAGGSPTCYIHHEAGGRECSPGTFVFWDKGYSEQLAEQPFEWAALVACRVVSKPDDHLICVDLGYKAVASENPLPRVFFLNATEAVPIAQSEEHLVLRVPDASVFKMGQTLYGVPWHICPTVALYDQACIAEENRITGTWKIEARTRRV